MSWWGGGGCRALPYSRKKNNAFYFYFPSQDQLIDDCLFDLSPALGWQYNPFHKHSCLACHQHSSVNMRSTFCPARRRSKPIIHQSTSKQGSLSVSIFDGTRGPRCQVKIGLLSFCERKMQTVAPFTLWWSSGKAWLVKLPRLTLLWTKLRCCSTFSSGRPQRSN